MAKAQSLLKAYLTGSIPEDGGFIVSAYFMASSTYGIYEITSYSHVKDIIKGEEGLSFRTDGNRTYILVESPTYAKKYVEPVHRDQGLGIPYRFNEVTILTGRRSERIMVPLEPMTLHSTFTIVEHAGDSYSFVFHTTDDVYIAIKKFLADSLYNDCNLSKNDALEAANLALDSIKKFSIWK